MRADPRGGNGRVFGASGERFSGIDPAPDGLAALCPAGRGAAASSRPREVAAMPGAVLHRLFAGMVLDQWRSSGDLPPFSLHDDDVVEAFYQGAVGPDMGYYVRGGRRISDLAHRARPADLARAILHQARSPAQRAYAWGWVTHVLADVALHPLINRASAELVPGASGGSLSAEEHPVAHLRVELGLDAYLQARHFVPPGTGVGVMPSAGAIRFLAAAYRRTYGPEVSAADLLRAFRGSIRLTPLVLLHAAWVAAGHRALRGRASGTHARCEPIAGGGEGWLDLVRGFLIPVPPAPWLVREVGRRLAGLVELLRTHHATGVRELQNMDLDTGHPCEPLPRSPGRDAVLLPAAA